ncbi:unnamed protein product [Prunus armeniaca]
MLAWKPPPPSTMKLNVDGSRKDSSGAIAAGGLIQNSAGDWIAGFSSNLGHGDILKAELSALCHGLELAQKMQVTKLIVETDCKPVLDHLNANLEDRHPLLIFRNKCISYWKSSWDCEIIQVFREVNSAADALANMGHGMELGTHFFDMPPDGIKGVLQDDRAGRARSRLISV